MGEAVTRKPVPAPPADSRGTDTGKQSGPRTQPDSRTPAPGTPEPARAGTPAGTPAGGTRAPEKEKVPGLAPVKDAAPAPAEPKKKQRKAAPKKKKQEEPQPFSVEQLSALFMTASAIVSSRPGMEVWALREDEAMQLSQPIANMVAKSEKLKNAGEYADAIALTTAAMMIFGPRAFVYSAQQKQKKIERSGGVSLVRTDSKKPESKGSSGKPDKPSPAQRQNDVPSLYDSIPATVF